MDIRARLTLIICGSFLWAGLQGNAAAAPVLQIDPNGILTGALGVNVSGTLYNVSFVDGSCNSVFNGCSDGSFTFSTALDAAAASLAILNDILIDRPGHLFDTIPDLTRGCTFPGQCLIFTPSFILGGTSFVQASGVLNSFNNAIDRVGVNNIPSTLDFLPDTKRTWAVWSVPQTVPLPPAFPLLVGGFGLLLRRGRKRTQ